MAVTFKLRHLLLLTAIASPAADAGTYVGLSTTLIQIKTDTSSAMPLMADLRLGYALNDHKLELAIMSGINDDNINQLVIEVPSAASVQYRYTTNPRHSTKIDLIVGYSQVDITSSYVQIPEATETFNGLSFGIGFEEALENIPQLKFKFDFVQLYRGDQLKINSFSAGFRYEF